jgi:hypothetical protein
MFSIDGKYLIDIDKHFAFYDRQIYTAASIKDSCQ